MSLRRERAVFWALVALVVGAAGLAYVLLLGAPPGRPAPAPAPVPAPQEVRLLVGFVTGTVEVERGGTRRAVVPGEELAASDVIVTGPGASVKLTSATFDVELEEAGRVGVEQITPRVSRVRLESGLVSARVADDPGRSVEIAAASTAVARTTGGDLQVAASGTVVAVAVERGAAQLTSAGRTVEVAAGQQSVAAAGAEPTAPGPIPSSLLLKVAWPEEKFTNRRRIVVSGRTEPGAIVVIGNSTVEVQPDGRFRGTVELREGEQRPVARARAAGGLTAEDRGPPMVLDTRAPDARFDTGGLWDKEGR